jgi:hypothetical protein
MKVLIDIPDKKAVFGLQVLKSLDFVKKIEENPKIAKKKSKKETRLIEDSQETSSQTEDEAFELMWNDPTNITPEQLVENLKVRFTELWKNK